MAAPVVHFEIGCENLEQTTRFYSEVFGWDAPGCGQNPAMVGNLGPYAESKSEGIGGHISALGHPPHQYVTFYIQVDDIEASLEKISKRGGSTLIAIQEVPGMGRFAWFKDPEGNCIGLWKAMSH